MSETPRDVFAALLREQYPQPYEDEERAEWLARYDAAVESDGAGVKSFVAAPPPKNLHHRLLALSAEYRQFVAEVTALGDESEESLTTFLEWAAMGKDGADESWEVRDFYSALDAWHS